ncbi:MAG: ABC transporter permease [Rhodomicrobiaceae bacterium]
MSVLDIKLFRDLKRIWAQALAIALVMACGVATIILAVGTYRSLDQTRQAFYDRYQFGSVFATTVRAPDYLKSRIENLSGVGRVELRIRKPVILDIKKMKEPASGLAVSIPDNRELAVNKLYLRNGRLPEKGRDNEVVVIHSFAQAHGFQPGDRFKAIFNGKKHELKIVGVIFSPESIYVLGPGDMVPDQRRYGVIFMSKSLMEGLFDMEGSFNDVSLTVMKNANIEGLIDQLDNLLKPFGGNGAYSRKDQFSNAFLDSELNQLYALAKIIPPIFLFVSAFLVNMILSRLVALEREQVGLLKALGYSNLVIGGHYAKLVTIIALIGLVLGGVAGFWLGLGLTRLYAEFFSFPFLIFRHSFDLYILAGSVTVFAALAGATKAIWSIVSLAPAVAMSPPAPTRYSSTFLSHLQKLKLFSQLSVMALRHLIRHPARSFLTTLGIALSGALLIAALFTYDSIDYMIDVVFFQTERQDATLFFADEQHLNVMTDVMALPGIIKAEPFRVTPVKLKNSHFELRMNLTGLPKSTDLARILDIDMKPTTPLPTGVMISERVATKLNLKPGHLVEIELTEKDNRIVKVPVIGMTQSYVGLRAYMQLRALNQLMRDGQQVSGARLMVDDTKLDKLYATIKETPEIASIGLQNISRDRFRATIEENITTMTTVYVVLAIIITFGVIYNSARIQLSERARELASLRVFGFSKLEVSSVLFIEVFVILFLAQPLGWLLGYVFSWSIVKGFENDLFRIPFVILPSTYAWATLIVLSSATACAMIVRRRIDAMNLIWVLKTRE